MENRPNVAVPINNFESYPNASYSKKLDKPEKETTPKPKGVVPSKHVSFKKQSAWKKAKHRIFEREGQNVKDYVLDEVLIPTGKDVISNLFSNVIDIILYGEPRHSSYTNRNRGYVPTGSTVRYGGTVYNTYSSSSLRKPVRETPMSNRRNYLNIDEIVFDSKFYAEDIKNIMVSIVNRGQIVTASDLYDMIAERDETGNLVPTNVPYTYNNYGWDCNDGLERCAIIRNPGGGWFIDLPAPKLLTD